MLDVKKEKGERFLRQVKVSDINASQNPPLISLHRSVPQNPTLCPLSRSSQRSVHTGKQRRGFSAKLKRTEYNNHLQCIFPSWFEISVEAALGIRGSSQHSIHYRKHLLNSAEMVFRQGEVNTEYDHQQIHLCFLSGAFPSCFKIQC